ncbi:hypothetical protein HY405_00915, partial [Candidatus Microgenomates bacterium]|nr:hypothetical protein [Candidatus Microgenomates bacterium]
MANPLSDFSVSKITTELSLNKDFAALSTAEQLQILNSVIQEIADEFIAKGKDHYRINTLTDATIIDAVVARFG